MTRRRPGVWVFVLTGMGLVLAAILIWVGLDLLRAYQSEANTSWQDPVLRTHADRTVPRLALLSLAGWPDQQIIEMAFSEGQWETAYTTLAYSTQLGDRERAGLWLRLAQGMVGAGETARAALCYQQVETIAILSPTLSNYVRADGLSQAALGLAQVGRQADLASRLAEETLIIARESPDLKPVLRQQLVERVAEVYRELGLEEERREAEALLSSGELAAAQAAEPGAERILPTLEAVVEVPEPLARVVEARRKAALQVAKAIAQSGQASGDQKMALAQALQQEDAVQESQLDALQEQAIRLGVKAAVARKRVQWLTLKYRVARGDYGLSLVPAWEERAVNIRSSLAKAYQDLYSLYEDQVVALPRPAQVQQGWVEVLREEAKTGRLGLYPNYPEQQTAERLVRRSEEWLQSHPDAFWRIATVETNGGLDYVLRGR